MARIALIGSNGQLGSDIARLWSTSELGMRGDELVGITKYCVHPAERVGGVEQVGGTKDPDLARIVAASAGGAFARIFAAIRPPAAQRDVERDTLRFFPHMAERSAGFARGARVSPLALAGLSAQPEHAPADALRVVKGARGASIARAIPTETTVATTSVDIAKARLATSSAKAAVRCSLPSARLAGGVKPDDLMGLRITNLEMVDYSMSAG